MDIKLADGPGITFDKAKNAPTDDEMKEGNHILQFGSKSALSSLHLPVLQQLCSETSTLTPRAKKPALIQSLLDYRVRQGWFTSAGKPIITEDAIDSSPTPDHTSNFVYPPNPSPSPKVRIKTFEDANDFYLTASKTMMFKLTKPDLIYLFNCKVKQDHSLSEEEVASLSNEELRSFIQIKRKTDGIVNNKGCLFSTNPTKTRVLGTEVLAAVREDMERLSLPSWVPRAPAHPGEKRWGKFSADQWRTFCTLILPITLIRLWGSHPEDSREKQQLDNFLHLVAAVKIGTQRKITKSDIAQYEIHMHTYLTTLLTLYENAEITPYQHLALHFGPLLENFGPTQSWRCFPFERYNYLMQKIPTNQKFGELEKTMFRKFCNAQNLRTLFTPPNIPSVLTPLVDLYRDRFTADVRGTLLQDSIQHDSSYQPLEESITWKSSQMMNLPSTTFEILRGWILENDELMGDQPISRRVFDRDEITRIGQTFSTQDTSTSNCHVVHMQSNENWTAACIQSLFSHTRTRSNGSSITQTFALVREYGALRGSDVAHDDYRHYPDIGCQLFHTRFTKIHRLLTLDQIDGHFAYIIQAIGGKERLLALRLQQVSSWSLIVRKI
ncbi:hypothetical protein NLJ89_g6753 [Agrocybe chaxingu]|uniref:DUF4218 domain-containing protein n=1 Tax=Agrocybe chaxingu TaxID=84603 RepID=A0A9W8MW40_9AGAR|nr:hypothetical protein NLJ89_g6753 [Agrocybe chaxingu]